jgi:hypothetical protein
VGLAKSAYRDAADVRLRHWTASPAAFDPERK